MKFNDGIISSVVHSFNIFFLILTLSLTEPVLTAVNVQYIHLKLLTIDPI